MKDQVFSQYTADQYTNLLCSTCCSLYMCDSVRKSSNAQTGLFPIPGRFIDHTVRWSWFKLLQSFSTLTLSLFIGLEAHGPALVPRPYLSIRYMKGFSLLRYGLIQSFGYTANSWPAALLFDSQWDISENTWWDHERLSWNPLTWSQVRWMKPIAAGLQSWPLRSLFFFF